MSLRRSGLSTKSLFTSRIFDITSIVMSNALHLPRNYDEDIYKINHSDSFCYNFGRLICHTRYSLLSGGTRRNFGVWRHCIFIWRSADCPYYWGAVYWNLESMMEKWVPTSVVSVQNVFLILNRGVFHHILWIKSFGVYSEELWFCVQLLFFHFVYMGFLPIRRFRNNWEI